MKLSGKSRPNYPTYLRVLIGLAGLAAVLGVYWLSGNGPREVAARVAMGSALYAENCAACHGANLEGQPNWQVPQPDGTLPPPPHDQSGHSWHHADQLLFDYTKLGGAGALARSGVAEFNSGMPAFGEILSDSEITAILTFIKSRWPEKIQASQKKRTRAADAAIE